MERSHILSLIRTGNAKKTPLFKDSKQEELLIRWRKIEKQRASHMERLVQTFKTECGLLNGKVLVARTDGEACQYLSSIIREGKIQKVVKWDSSLLGRMKIESLLHSLGIQNMFLAEKRPLNEVDRKEYIRYLSRAELGISGADYGLADTGTLVLRALPTQDRVTSLLPPVHVAFIESKHILSCSEDLIVKLMIDMKDKGHLDSCLTLITGPSLTADIELNLVFGVHGPKELHVIIVESD